MLIQLFVAQNEEIAPVYAVEMAKKMGLLDPEVVNTMVMHPAEGCFVEVKGKVAFDIKKTTLKIPQKEEVLPEERAAGDGQAGGSAGGGWHGGRG